MRKLSIGAATASLLLLFLSGCASSPVVMRGQSPDAYARAPQRGNIQRVGYNNYDQYYANMQMDPMVNGGYCDGDGCGHNFCAPPSCYKFQYVVPQGLNYPPPNALPGVLQYPYYTVKGPDDFFHQ